MTALLKRRWFRCSLPTMFAAMTVLACIFAGVFYFILEPFHQIRQLRQRYEQVQRDMAYDETVQIMGSAGSQMSDGWYPAWDDKPLAPSEAARITHANRYSVQTFFLPVSFEITFDKNGRVVGKHNYD